MVGIKAYRFAAEKHAGQVRKYTGEPYIHHLTEVAGLVAAVELQSYVPVALLHDVLEDCDVTLDELKVAFSPAIAHSVLQLFDINQVGNRAARKAETRLRLLCAPAGVQTVKCADIISNASSIIRHDPKFAKVFITECKDLLDVLTKASPSLRELAYESLKEI